jgi:hypothetical protein
MKVQMSINSGAGNAPNVHSDIEAIGVHDLFEDRNGKLSEGNYFQFFIVCERREIRGVSVRGDQKVPYAVGISVQENERGFAPLKN